MLHFLWLASEGSTPVRSDIPDVWCSNASQQLTLPVIDMAALDNVIAEQLVGAAKTHGFMFLTNHGAGPHADAAISAVQRRLFSGSADELAAWRRSIPGYGPGLQHRQHNTSRRTLEGEYSAAQREDFVFVSPDDSTRKAAGDPHYTRDAAEIWYGDVEPVCPDSDICTAFAKYYRQMERVGAALRRRFAEVITQDADAWTTHFERHRSNLVAGFHRERVAGTDARKHLVTAHSDANLLTLIYYGAGGPYGLEIFDRACGGWLRVHGDAQLRRHSQQEPPLLLNLGDEMVWLTNGKLRATPHRVVDRMAHGATRGPRLALIFFYAAAYDAVLMPHVDAGETPTRRPMLVGRHTYNFRTALPAQRDTFDAWARDVGLLAAEDVVEEHQQQAEALNRDSHQKAEL